MTVLIAERRPNLGHREAIESEQSRSPMVYIPAFPCLLSRVTFPPFHLCPFMTRRRCPFASSPNAFADRTFRIVIRALHSNRRSIIDAVARGDTSIINLNLHIPKTRALVNHKLLVVRHRDLRCAADGHRNEVVDPSADEECADSPDPGSKSQA